MRARVSTLGQSFRTKVGDKTKTVNNNILRPCTPSTIQERNRLPWSHTWTASFHQFPWRAIRCAILRCPLSLPRPTHSVAFFMAAAFHHSSRRRPHSCPHMRCETWAAQPAAISKHSFVLSVTSLPLQASTMPNRGTTSKCDDHWPCVRRPHACLCHLLRHYRLRRRRHCCCRRRCFR